MARITVDDCLKLIPNRFSLTLAATYRARQLAQVRRCGSGPLVSPMLPVRLLQQPAELVVTRQVVLPAAGRRAGSAPAAARGPGCSG